HDDVVVGLDDGVVVRHDDLVAARQRADAGAPGQADVADRAAHHLGIAAVAVRDGLDGLGHALPQAMHGGDVAAAHVAQQFAQGGLRRRHGDVDVAALHQFAVGLPVDQRDHLAGPLLLGQHRRIDVVIVVAGLGQPGVHVLDLLALEQLFVGAVAVQDQHIAGQFGDQVLAALGVALDDAHAVAFVGQLAGQAQADVAAAGDHDAAHGLLGLAQLAHGAARMAGVDHQHHFVARRDDGAAVGLQGPAVAHHVDHARRHVGPHFAQLRHRVVGHGAAVAHAHREHADAPVGEFDHLQGLGELDQAVQVGGDAALGADQGVDAEALLAHELGMLGEIGHADAGDAPRHIEQLPRDLAAHHVGRVGGRTGDEQVGVGRPGRFQHGHLGAVAMHHAQVEAVLQVAQVVDVRVDDGNVVLLGHQVFGQAGADTTGPHDEDLHVPRLRADSMPSCLSLRYRWVRSSPVRSDTRVML